MESEMKALVWCSVSHFSRGKKRSDFRSLLGIFSFFVFFSSRLGEWAEPHGTGFHEVSAFLSWILFHFSTSFLSFIFLFPGTPLVLGVWAALGGQGTGIITSGIGSLGWDVPANFSRHCRWAEVWSRVSSHSPSLMHRSIPQSCHRHEESCLGETKKNTFNL